MKDLKLALVSLLVLFQIGCGTDTGNPGLRTPKDFDATGAVPFASTFVNEFCGRLQSCHSELSSERCQIGIYDQELMVPTLGLDINRFNSLAEVYESEIQEILFPKPSSNQCLSDLRDLECESVNVKQAFDEEADHPFSKAYRMVPQSCKGSY